MALLGNEKARPIRIAKGALGRGVRVEIYTLFPKMLDYDETCVPAPARLFVKGRKVPHMVVRHIMRANRCLTSGLLMRRIWG